MDEHARWGTLLMQLRQYCQLYIVRSLQHGIMYKDAGLET